MKLKWSDVTPQADFLNRRMFVAAGLASLATPALGLSGEPVAFARLKELPLVLAGPSFGIRAQLDEAAKTQDELVIAAVYPLEKLLRATKVE